MNFRKGGGSRLSEKFRCRFSGKGGGGGTRLSEKISLHILAPPEKKGNIVFRNEGGGSVRGRLEVFRKFIRFGEDRRSL